MKRRIWITWEYQPRNISMSKSLGCEYLYFSTNKSGLIRYLLLSYKTILVLSRMRKGIVFSQNPSIVLSFIVVLLRHAFCYTCIVDEHNAGLFPLDRKSKILNLIADYIARNADLLIVTNRALKEYCEKLGARALVCPDPIPDMFTDKTITLNHSFSIMLVCSWAEDEPYQEVIAAAERLRNSDVVIYATGKPGKKLDGLVLPNNFKQTGYLSNSEYKATMAAVEAVMVLTTRDDCMNCGAYEAVASEKPGIVSDRSVLRNYFNEGFLFTENNADNIYSAIIKMKQEYSMQSIEIKNLKSRLLKSDSRYISAVENEIDINRTREK